MVDNSERIDKFLKQMTPEENKKFLEEDLKLDKVRFTQRSSGNDSANDSKNFKRDKQKKM